MLQINSKTFNNPKLEKKIMDKLKSKAELAVGFIDGSKYPNGESVATVAFWQEYGTYNIPARPFFRTAIKENKKKWLETYKQAFQQHQDGIKALEITGTIAKGDIAQSITTFNTPANSPYTIEKKGSSNPLVNTGFMRSNVDYEVTK